MGAGPAGIYAAEALSQQTDVAVEIAVIDRLPVPFGLVRYGVAPDHHSIRSIRHTLERTLEKPSVRFYGDVDIGSDLSISELRESVDAVIYAYGAGSDRRLEIPGEHLSGSIAAAELVAWYCGHPDVHSDTDQPGIRDYLVASEIDELIRTSHHAVVVGIGNVALDVARVLIKTVEDLDDTDMADEVLESLARKNITDVHVLGRRGPAYTAFTTKELREMGQLADVDVIIDPADLELDPSSQAVVQQNKVAARNLVVLQEWAARPLSGASRRIRFHFWSRPTMIIGNDRVTAVEVERTMIDSDGFVVGIGDRQTLAADLVVRSVGYRGLPLPGVPFDESTGRVPHSEGRVIRDGGFSPDEYVTGWIKRGPTGVIGTNKSDAVETVTSLLADLHDGAVRAQGRSGHLDRLLAQRGIRALGMPAWHRIDAAEVELGARRGRLRTTLAHRHELLAAAEMAADDDAHLTPR
ncbi:MAG TPA: FAD-dependent oxidoreductase [Propionibacteriaceae bacterium]